MACQKVSGPSESAARAGTGTRLTGAVAHEWQSVSTVDGAGRPSQYHPQSPVPVSQIRHAGPVRLGLRPGPCLLVGPNASGPSAARAGTGTRLASAVAHERPSISTVDGAGRPSPFHSQSPAPVSQIRRAVTFRFGQGRGRARLGRSERQRAVRCTCRDWDPAGWCRRPRVAVSSDRRWGWLLKPAPPSVPSPHRTRRAGPARLGPWQTVCRSLCLLSERCNVQIGNGFRRGHFKKEETVKTVS